MVAFTQKDSYTVADLVEIVHLLRQPDGCPWDREQTHHTIRRNMLEEAYEAVEAIDSENPDYLKEELGDVLLQVVLHAEMEREIDRFDLDGVADGISKKLIFRHPHVFGDVEVTGTGEVLQNWEELKRKEKKQDTFSDSVDAVAKSLPGLWRAEKMQKKAKKAGFDWPDVSGALEKLEEEVGELREAVTQNTNVAEELGDVLFAAVNVARFAQVDPEVALAHTCDKFGRRFRQVEAMARAEGRDMTQMSLEELDALWDRVKAIEKE